MYRGKNKCRILKEIRAEIARSNGIAYTVEECKYKGDCTGTCPKCEAEVRALEDQLARRSALGKKVALTGVALGIALSVAGCSAEPATPTGDAAPLGGEPMPVEFPLFVNQATTTEIVTVPSGQDTETDKDTNGSPESDTETDGQILMGFITPPESGDGD